jgi:hypothetical protein
MNAYNDHFYSIKNSCKGFLYIYDRKIWICQTCHYFDRLLVTQ